MGPPPSNVVPPVVALVVRILTFICVLISIIVLATNTFEAQTDYGDVKIKFKDFHAYRYLLATSVIGLAYSLLQTVLTVFQVATGNRIGGDLRFQIDFYGDKIISYLLATGAAASFGMTQDLKRIQDGDNSDLNKFLNVSNAAASMCFLGFLFCAISSVFSSYALPKQV